MAKAGNQGWSTKSKKPVDKRRNSFRNELKRVVSPEDFAEVVGKLMQQAKNGNVRAAQIFLSYTLGLPKQQVEVESTERQFSVQIIETAEGKHTNLANADGVPLVKFSE